MSTVQFKVGDRVRVTTKRFDTYTFLRYQFGDIGTVDKVSHSGFFPVRVMFDAGSHSVSDVYEHSDLERLTAVKPTLAAEVSLKPTAKRILGHLRSRGSISPMVALNSHNNPRLAASIYDLRKAGYKIDMEMREDEPGHKYARYTLAQAA